MEAKELRIGNYIYRPDLTGVGLRKEKILELGEKAIVTGPIKVKCDYFELSPIPLTKEWLVKFGFEKISQYFYKKEKFSIELFVLDNINWAFRFRTTEKSSIMIASIQHVHQLQNIYFALTNEEIEVTYGVGA